MLLNNELVIKFADLFISRISGPSPSIGPIEHDLGNEITLTMDNQLLWWQPVINGTLIDVVDVNDFEIENIRVDIAKTLIQLVLMKHDETEILQDLTTGVTTNISHDFVIGLTVKCDIDVDRKTLMVCQTANPNNVLYAFEEAVNMDLSMSHELLTHPSHITSKIERLFSDYLMADMITHDVAI